MLTNIEPIRNIYKGIVNLTCISEKYGIEKACLFESQITFQENSFENNNARRNYQYVL